MVEINSELRTGKGWDTGKYDWLCASLDFDLGALPAERTRPKDDVPENRRISLLTAPFHRQGTDGFPREQLLTVRGKDVARVDAKKKGVA